jgi:hypothetical protein
MRKERDFAEYRGKLAGKIVLVSYPEEPKDQTEAPFRRFEDADIKKLDVYRQPSNDPDALKTGIETRTFPRQVDAFLKAAWFMARAIPIRLGRLPRFLPSNWRRRTTGAWRGWPRSGLSRWRSTAVCASTTATPRRTTSSPIYRAPILPLAM